MAEITAAAVKALRAKTDLPMMECKKALMEADGDEAKAVEILREQFKKVQIKRQDNSTEEGRIFAGTSDDGSVTAMIEIQCESAPVATGETMDEFGTACLKQMLAGSGAETAEELLAQTPEGSDQPLQTLYEEMVNKIREKIVVTRLTRVEGPVGSYVHHDKKSGVLFEAKGDTSKTEMLRDVAMHIAALMPSCTLPAEVDADAVSAERARLTEEAKASGKPDNIVDKIVDGRMKNFYVEQGVLVAQPFAKDDSKTVEKALSEVGLEAVRFTRWRIGDAS